MPLPKIQITMKKDGRQVAWFREEKGRVRTRVGVEQNWTRAEQIRELAEYGIQLQLDQVARGLGSDGAPMPPLKSGQVKFVQRVEGRAQFARKTIRNLYGPGIGGHMLDDIRINYLDDKKATINITKKLSRDKARNNERLAPWWGWSPESAVKMHKREAEIFPQGVAERLVSMGMLGVHVLSGTQAGRFFRGVA